MSENEREYWLAGGADKEKAEAFISEREAIFQAMATIIKEIGADNSITRGGSIAGLSFDGDECPAGWREVTRMQDEGKYRPYFMPKRTTKALKEICKKLSSVHAKGASQFTGHMGGSSVMKASDGLGMRILYMSWEYIGSELLLSIPVGDTGFKANGSRKLAMSEYWAMKEASEARTLADATNKDLP